MIKNLKTTYKGLDIELNNLTSVNYIVGINGTGKSRLLEFIEKKSKSILTFPKSKIIIDSFNEVINEMNQIIEGEIDSVNHVKIFSLEEIYSTNLPNVHVLTNSDNINFEFQYHDSKHNLSQTQFSENSELFEDIFKILELYDRFPKKIIKSSIVQFQNEFNETIPFFKISNNKIMIVNSDKGNPYEIKHDLSSGMGFILKLITCLIEAKDRYGVICFEEPETNLHPSIIKKIPSILNKFLTKYNKQIFITTHSPFLIRGALQHDNHKIFHLEKGMLKSSFDKKKLIEQSGLPFDNVLSDLGFEMKDIYYPNCLIYVEGPVEVLFISYWLEKYVESKKLTKNHFVKGIDYDFVEFGGSLAAHLSLKFNSQTENEAILDKTELVNIFSLNRKVFVMVDNDTDKKAFEKTKQRLKKELQEKNNGSIFYRNSKYSTIESLLTKSTKRSKRVKDKLGAAIVNIKYWRKNNIGLDKFNSETINLCKRIFEFIETSNSL